MSLDLRKIVGLGSGSPLERVARSLYYGARGLGKAWDWYQETDEREKFVHIFEAVNYLRVADMPKVFFEFGCYSGRTFSAALLAARLLKIHLDAYAFDSFQGLPPNEETRSGVFAAGAFRMDRPSFRRAVHARTRVWVPEDHMVEGFYDSSLTPEFSRRLPPHVGFVHIDVDLYQSTVPVLRFLTDKLVSGTVLLFDDWYCFSPGSSGGERRALEEFREQNPEFTFEEWKNYSGFGKSLFVIRHGSAEEKAR